MAAERISVSYAALKASSTKWNLAYNYVDFGITYAVFLDDVNNNRVLLTELKKNVNDPDTTDFESNIKASATLVTSVS